MVACGREQPRNHRAYLHELVFGGPTEAHRVEGLAPALDLEDGLARDPGVGDSVAATPARIIIAIIHVATTATVPAQRPASQAWGPTTHMRDLFLIGLDLDIDADTSTFRSHGLAALGSPEVVCTRRLPATSLPFQRKALLRRAAREVRDGLVEHLSYGSVVAAEAEIAVRADRLIAHPGDAPDVLELLGR